MPADLIVARRHPVPEAALTYEPAERWVRGTIGETTVVDSRHPLLLWEPGRAVPRYLFPAADVRTDLLEPTSPPDGVDHPGGAAWYDLVLGGRRYPHLVWSYEGSELGGHYAFEWFGRTEPGVEHWYEEDEEIFIHPRDPYKRVDPLRSSRHVQVSFAGKVLADTHHPVLLFETRLPIRYYFPPEDVDFSLLEPTDLRTGCPYKGFARYWSVKGAGAAGENIVWSYPEPIGAAANIKGLVAFYNEVVDLTVDGVALPRPESEFSRRLASSGSGT